MGGNIMTQYTTDTHVKNGHLELNNIPIADNIEVRVCVVPKVKLAEMSFQKTRKLTKSIKGNLSDTVETERNERTY
jgi:hypothetical protein